MIIKTYKLLGEYIKAFSDNNISLLVIRSYGGLSKTHTVKTTINDADCQFFNGHATPLSIYMQLQKNPEHLVVFDDVDSLINNKVTVSLLKQFCELSDNKTIRYNTTHKIAGEVVEPKFTSNNKVCLLCNDFKRIGHNIKALLSRGIYIDFKPSHSEILTKMRSFKDLDMDIYNYLNLHNTFIKQLNLRTYFKCVELKRAKLDWKNYLDTEYHLEPYLDLAIQISNLPIEERNVKWILETGKSVRTLQRMLKKRHNLLLIGV